MGAPVRRSTRSVVEILYDEPQRFDFYQAALILERLRPDAVPLGEGVERGREAVRFTSDPGLSFPPSDVRALTPAVAPTVGESVAAPPVMEVSFLGLAGARGPLPHAVTEILLQRLRSRDMAFRDFLDIFNHRLVSLMYRVRRHTRLAMSTEPPEKTRFAGHLLAFLGLGTPHLQGRLGPPDRVILPYVGLLAGRARSAPGLEILLSDHFAVPVKVESFVGRHLYLEADERTALGRWESGRNNVLGETAVVGARVWDRQSTFALHIGPLTLRGFLDFLPIGRGHAHAVALTRFHVGEHLDFDLRLTLRPEEVPQARLGRTDGSYLGWTSWLKRRPESRRPGRVRLSARRQTAS
jgi:type VI secretion system protein ImpH